MGCEKTAMLTLYRRHSEKCPVHKLKLTLAAKRKYMDCECPLWIYGNTETTHEKARCSGLRGVTSVVKLGSSARC